jgi:molecular chaperone DnaK (HSP70)
MDVLSNDKAVLKLYKECERVKKILSANTKVDSQREPEKARAGAMRERERERDREKEKMIKHMYKPICIFRLCSM